MSDDIYITVNIQYGRKFQTVKMEKGTSFENKSCVFTALKDGETIKLNNYQMQVFQAVANNFKENNTDEIILSKKDIDIAIKKYSKGELGEDLSQFLNSSYKVQNPKAFRDENKISAYITNGKASTSAVLCFKYNNTAEEIKSEKTNNQSTSVSAEIFKNNNIIMQKPIKYTFKEGDNIPSVARNFEVDTYQIIAANPQLKEGVDYKVNYVKSKPATIDTYIKPGTTITIPARYSVREGAIKNFTDLCNLTGLSRGYIEDLLTIVEVSPKHPGKPDLKTYNDGYGMPTIGYGHTGKVDGKVLSLKKRITITETKALQILAEDLIKHEAMVIAYLGKENYEKAPASVKAAILDVAYNKGIWDGFLNPYHNSSTSKIKTDLQERHYASALCHTPRMNTPNRGLKRRNLYRFISGLSDLTPAKRESAMREMNGYYNTVLKSLKGAEKTYMQRAWENAKLGKTTGYRIHTTQTDRK